MKRIFSRVAHAFKHDDPAVQDDGQAAESASMTSVDSGVLDDVSPEPPSDQRRGSGGRHVQESPTVPDPASERDPTVAPISVTADTAAAPDRLEVAPHDSGDSAVTGLCADVSPVSNGSPSIRQLHREPAETAAAAAEAAAVHAGQRAAATDDLHVGPSSPHAADRLIRRDSTPGTAAAAAATRPAPQPDSPSTPTAAPEGDASLQTTAEAAASGVCDGGEGDSGAVSKPMSEGEVLGVSGDPAAATSCGDLAVTGTDAVPRDNTGEGSSVEKSATDTSLAESGGLVLETGTEDTGDDLDGKPKEKKKKKRKKKNKPAESNSASLDPVLVVSTTNATATSVVETEKAAEANGLTPIDSNSKQTVPENTPGKLAVSAAAPKSKLSSGKKAGKTPTAQTPAGKKAAETASQRRSGAQAPTRASAAKQTNLETNSRSSTPSRTPENPARTRLKRDLQKAVSIESNSSTGSRTSTSSRPSSAARKVSGTTPRAAVARKNSLTTPSASVSTPASNREDVRSPPVGRESRTASDRKTAKTSATGAKKVSDSAAAGAAKTSPNKKLSSPAQAQPVKTERKTKTSIAKEKKVPSGRKKSEKVGVASPADKASEHGGKSAQSKHDTGSLQNTKTMYSKKSPSPDIDLGREPEQLPEEPCPVKYNHVEEAPFRPPLDKDDTIQETIRRPPLTQDDTIDVDPSLPSLMKGDAAEENIVRPPLLEQETIEETAALPTMDQQQERIRTVHQSLLSDRENPNGSSETVLNSKNGLIEAVNTSLVNGVNGATPTAVKTAMNVSIDVPDNTAPVPTISIDETFESSDTAVPSTSPYSKPSPASGGDSDQDASPSVPAQASDLADPSSRRSSVEVLDEGRPKLRRSCSNQGDPLAPHDPVLQVMTQVHADSEARLAARRQARAEAREIRMRELERQQREAELNGEKTDDFADVPVRSSPAGSTRTSRGVSGSLGRRASEDSAEDGPGPALHLRDVRHELRELEEKLRKTMVTSAQLDNDKSTLGYQVELLKDRLEDLQEAHTQLQREHRTRCSDHEQLKRVSNRLKEDLTLCKRLLDERDKLIAENGLVLVGDEEEEKLTTDGQKALVSQTAAELLEKAGGGTLDSRLRRLGEEKNELEDQLRRLKLELEEERHMNARARISGSGGAADSDAVQREVGRQLGEYRFKLQKADQDITNLQTAVQRLENQVARYKTAAETAEKAEEELKGEKRKLQRELRESLTRVDELETTNSHLQKRLDKLKNARSNLLKDLSAE